VAADITLLETANEFVARYRGRQGKQQPNSKQAPPWEATETSIAHSSSQRRLVDRPGQPLGDLAGDLARVEFSGGGVSDNAAKTFDVGPLPMLASSCPGWICYAEKTHPAVLPYVSTVKSPQQVMGVLVKQFLGPEIGVAPKDIFHVTVMPCFDKKLEASRLDFFHQDEASDSESPQGFNEVDLVLTSVEVHNLIEQLAEEQDLSPVQFLTSPLNDAHGGDDQGTRRREAGPSQRLPIESLLCSNGERAQEGGGGLPLLRAALSSSSSSRHLRHRRRRHRQLSRRRRRKSSTGQVGLQSSCFGTLASSCLGCVCPMARWSGWRGGTRTFTRQRFWTQPRAGTCSASPRPTASATFRPW